MKQFKCPICNKKYINTSGVCNHIDSNHPNVVPKEVTTLQWIFNLRNKLPPNTTHGKSILSKKPTPWNETSGRYERLADEKERQEFRKLFIQRMIKVHGKDTLLRDPEVQKKMLEGRKISGVYTYSDGSKFKYTGSYELDFIRFMDTIMNWDSKDIFMPSPTIVHYKSPRDDSEHFYIPDVYIESLKTAIEIKSSENKHYRARDLDIENAKDDAIRATGINFIKIYDKDYEELGNFLKSHMP